MPSYTHYEVNPKYLNKSLEKTEKYGRMIDPKDVVEGQEFLNHIQCKGCNKIPLNLTSLKECKSCKSVICYNCYHVGATSNEDEYYDRIKRGEYEDLEAAICICP